MTAIDLISQKEFTVNAYFFVSTILKILTDFSFGNGMVFTEKYRPIPTEKYQSGIQL